MFAAVSEVYLKTRIPFYFFPKWKHYFKNSAENCLWFLNSPHDLLVAKEAFSDVLKIIKLNIMF